jgi:hypothetical protein
MRNKKKEDRTNRTTRRGGKFTAASSHRGKKFLGAHRIQPRALRPLLPSASLYRPLPHLLIPLRRCAYNRLNTLPPGRRCSRLMLDMS